MCLDVEHAKGRGECFVPFFVAENPNARSKKGATPEQAAEVIGGITVNVIEKVDCTITETVFILTLYAVSAKMKTTFDYALEVKRWGDRQAITQSKAKQSSLISSLCKEAM